MAADVKYLKPRAKPGTPVWFQPYIGTEGPGSPRYSAVTSCWPYKVGQRDVVNIEHIRPHYAPAMDGTLHKVAFAVLSLREDTTPCMK